MQTTPRTRTILSLAVPLAIGATLAGFSPASIAGPFTAGPLIAATPATGIPAPPDPHPGKEYSDERDKNADTPPGGVADDSATILFDGAPPGGVTDGFDHDGAGTAGEDFRQVDAMANVNDALFFEVRENLTAMAFSYRNGAVLSSGAGAPGAGHAGVQGTGADVGAPIYFETIGGLRGTWATVSEVDQHGVRNLDSLEIWGPDGAPDGNRYSLFGDGLPLGGGTAIYNESPGFPDPTYLTHAALAAALVGSGLPEFAGFDTSILQSLLDIDALMVQDFGIAGSSAAFDDAADTILFSLWGVSPTGVPGFPAAPGSPTLIGDAIYVWNFATGVSHLSHGGHAWFDGWSCSPTPTGAPGECLQVDAIEGLAVPAPATLSLLGLGLVGLGLLRRRRAG